MAFDYESLLPDIIELLGTDGEEGFGRAVTLVALGNTAADPQNPWDGPASPRGTPSQTLSVNAVVVEPSSLDALGRNDTVLDFIKSSTQIALIYSATPLTGMDEMIDEDGSRWAITGLSRLKPGSVDLLWFVGLRRP